ncbi:carboxylesterase family protein [Nonomuraea pusilla]|uniref:carboxylesterase family protein n=1 Tax=Nonomuraea pusilla TaxID=46177 RepID=UPI0033339E76
MPEVMAPSGRWRGRDAGGVSVFHGIRYARADRFAPPRRVEERDATADATRPAPSAPQSPSRLEAVMGAPHPYEQSEDCLTVTVTTPGGAEPGSLPVLVWLHGGAYLSGSGEWNLYDATRLVRETGIVVVSVSYRLGVLGYLRAPGVSPGNLGLLDQITALEWVRDNIEAFGGDRARVTVAGQSAGAHSVAAMLGIERARGLFTRAILQSAPLGIGFHSRERARRVAALFLAELGVDPRRAAVADVLAAQGRTARRLARPAGLATAPPLLPVLDADPMPGARRWRETVRGRASGLQVLMGDTADEMEAFHGPHPVVAAVRRVPVLGPRLVAAVRDATQDRIFDGPVRRFADLLAGAGAEVYRYRVGRPHPGSPFGACHCVDLPLLLGDGPAWRDAPMLRPLSPGDVAALGARTRRYWGEFVRTGRIADPAWPAHRPGSTHLHPLP